MKRNKEILKQNENGITLIALVITIIVLLILAGVSIAMLTGENGILTQAQRAKEETEKAQANEENLLGGYEDAIYEATGDVKQVDDSNPGVLEGSGTKEDPFIINSIEDLIVFADNVTKGTNTYQDQYVELGLSLDFNSDKSYVNPNREDYAKYGYNGKLKEVLNTSGFIPIGRMEGTTAELKEGGFYGTFDGEKYKIYNLKIQQEKSAGENNHVLSGMFSVNNGIIQNVCIENGNNSTTMSGGKYLAVGLLVALNYGEISNCYTTGNVSTSKTDNGCNVGGLVGSNSGTIKECYNEANVNVKYSCRENRIGGIVGANEGTGIIENVYNVGNINSQVFAEQSKENENTCLIAGIVGRNMGSINNSYSRGKVSDTNNANIYKTTIDGVAAMYGGGTVDNCYYLENTITASEINTEITENGEAKSSTEMKSQEFLDLLNQDNSGMWKFSSGKNDGYPVLYWE